MLSANTNRDGLISNVNITTTAKAVPRVRFACCPPGPPSSVVSSYNVTSVAGLLACINTDNEPVVPPSSSPPPTVETSVSRLSFLPRICRGSSALILIGNTGNVTVEGEGSGTGGIRTRLTLARGQSTGRNFSGYYETRWTRRNTTTIIR
ncbi:hypothetical protein QLX08_001162 [Tetragonisca angustula]|uniref:Uncharacterized protein n=1 Tax=Tetragonisca angustula TaxID=166442 RepID=A0AAW1AG80_9HYME